MIMNGAFNAQPHCQLCSGVCNVLASQMDFMGLIQVLSQSPNLLLSESQSQFRDTASRCNSHVQGIVAGYLSNVTDPKAMGFFAGWAPPYPPYPEDWTYPLL